MARYFAWNYPYSNRIRQMAIAYAGYNKHYAILPDGYLRPCL
jgi:hypothetical protein